MKMLFHIAIILSVLWILPGESISKSFDGSESHSKDFCDCLGVKCESNANPYNTFKEISSLIDNVSSNGFYKKLKKKYGFKWEKGKSHRILFHWGFNEHPKSSEALRIRVEETVKRSKQEKFYEAVLEEQKRRNKKMISIIKRDFGLISRKKAGALTTIIYDIHILGDYACSTCSDFSSLYPVKKLLNDLNKRGIKRLFPFGPERNQLIRAINDAKRSGSNSEISQAVLITLKQDFPPLLEEHYSQQIASKGIETKKSPVQSLVKKFKTLF